MGKFCLQINYTVLLLLLFFLINYNSNIVVAINNNEVKWGNYTLKKISDLKFKFFKTSDNKWRNFKYSKPGVFKQTYNGATRHLSLKTNKKFYWFYLFRYLLIAIQLQIIINNYIRAE